VFSGVATPHHQAGQSRPETDALTIALMGVKQYCSLHWARWGVEADHLPVHCSHTDVRLFFDWKKTIRLPRSHQLCFYCWAPNPTRQGHKDSKQGECEVGDVLPQVAYGAWVEASLRPILEEIGLPRNSTEKEYGLWLVEEKAGVFNFMAVFWALNRLRTGA